MINQYGTRYIRYVDDFIVVCSSDSDTVKAFELAEKLLSNDGLTLPSQNDNESKTRTSIDLRDGDAFIFLGISVSKEGIHPKETKKELKLHIDHKCFAAKAIKMKLHSNKKIASNMEKEKAINARIQSKFGVYRYFHTKELLMELNQFIEIKAKGAKLNIRAIQSEKSGTSIVSQKEWQNYF